MIFMTEAEFAGIARGFALSIEIKNERKRRRERERERERQKDRKSIAGQHTHQIAEHQMSSSTGK